MRWSGEESSARWWQWHGGEAGTSPGAFCRNEWHCWMADGDEKNLVKSERDSLV